MSAVCFDRVRLALGTRTVLDDVSFAIADTEFVGVLGPNGAGKTTIMRAILGLLAPRAGHIAVLGQPARRGNPALGYMPQARRERGLHLRGWDFVAAAGTAAWGLPWRGKAERAAVDRALDLVDATALARRPLAALSGGERQRLLLAQALLGEPKLLLLDEPLISLDPHRQAEVVALVRDVQRRLGIAVLFSAHEVNPLLGAMDRVLYLGAGQVALGPVAEVITGPVLSRLYDTPIEVLELRGRLFVMSGTQDMERTPHPHAQGGHGNGREVQHARL
ncbi:MAG: ATP-binding cassette domain-containing protein [Proteobacteria bacterium]|nr:ATP-binding cassette domain-containing protein [Pseudomonadota bacterium]